MDHYNYPNDGTEPDIGWMTLLRLLLVCGLSAAVLLTWLVEIARTGPDIGTMIVFDSKTNQHHWREPEILAFRAPANISRQGGALRGCTLMPSVMAANGGSLMIEAKEMSQPPMFRVHWSGQRADPDAGDCGNSADLILQLDQVRALARTAGGYGIHHRVGMF